MYVKERAGYDVDTDPYAGVFGQIVVGDGHVGNGGGDYLDPFYGFGANGPSLSGSNPFEVAQAAGLVSREQLTSAFTECAAQVAVAAIQGGRSAALDAAAECAWNQLWVIINAIPEPQREALLISINTTESGQERSCSSALASVLGIPGEIASILCVLGSGFWNRITRRTGDELLKIWKARGGRRPDAEGGGWRVVDPSGTLVAVDCDGSLFEPSVRCPWTVSGGGGGGTMVAKVKAISPAMRSMLTTIGRGKPEDDSKDVEKTGEPSSPWYKNKWLWIGVGAVAVAGTAGFVVMRRRRRG
jgi:hypothetical protein